VDASDGGGRKDGLAVGAVSADDVISLVLTFFLAIVLTLAVLIWGRATTSQRT
jgi:hypothetical protein